MVQPAKRFEVWQRLYTRFGIEPFPADGEGPSVSTTVMPITDADALLRTTIFADSTGNLSAAAGTYLVYFTVPEGKVWILKGLSRGPSIANTQMRLVGQGNAFDVTILSTTAEFVSLAGIRLAEGETLGMLTTGDGGDTTILLQVVLEEEDVF